MTPFYKLSGAGNDFIALVEPERDPEPEWIVNRCRRGISLGADGVFALRRVEGAVRMTHWNADGGRAELCLNGSRCAVALACELGWGGGDGGKGNIEVRLVTDAGALDAYLEAPGRVSIGLPFAIARPDAPGAEAVTLDTPEGEVRGYFLVVGVPHLVVPVDGDPAAVDLGRFAPPLRRHADLGEAGANVDVVRWRPRSGLDLRTFERGVEGETLACGTGAVAAARVGVQLGLLNSPVEARTAGGFVLTVGERNGHVTLGGDARLVAAGELYPPSSYA